MRSLIHRSFLIIAPGLLLLSIAVCREGPDEAEEAPIVVEESGPIALGEPDTVPSEEEVQVVEEEPQVVRTVVVRERPAPERREEPAETPREEPRAPARPAAIPAGTRIPIALMAQIDTEHNEVGQSWTGRVTRDVVVNGVVVIPSGAAVSGVVTAMEEGDRTGGQGYITLDARSVETVAGTRSIAAAPVSGGHAYEDRGFPTRETAIGAGAGAVVGGIIGGKKGAAIGAAAGGAGGAAMGTARDDYEIAMDSGTELTLRLTSAITL